MLEQIAVSYGIPLAYIVFGVAALGAVAFPVLQMIQDLKKALTMLVATGIIVVIFIVCYALSSNEPHRVGDAQATAAQMRWVEAGMFMFYLLLAGSTIAILYSSVSRYFK